MTVKNLSDEDSSSSVVQLKVNGPIDVNLILINVIEQIGRNFNQINAVSSGFTDLDGMTQGLHAGELIVVASRPGMGKTTFALNLVESALQNSAKAVVIYSPVMPAKSLVMRMLSSIGTIDQTKLRHARLEDDDWPKLTSAVNILKDCKLSIDDDSGISLAKIRSRTRQLVEEHGDIGLIVVDNLKMVQLDGNDRVCRSHEASEIVCGLKALAQEFECPLVVTSGICRDLEKRQNKRPQRYDLSDSNAIEQVADVILFVYRDEIYNRRSKDKGVAEIIVAKQSLGYTGTVRLSFEDKYASFENLTLKSTLVS